MSDRGASPQRIQRRRTKGWRMPEGAVYVGRPTKWGNPFRVAGCGQLACGGTHHWHVVDNRDLYPEWRQATVVIVGTFPAAIREAVRFYRLDMAALPVPAGVLAELAGRDLVCWCPLDQPCHADVLLEIANRRE